LICALTTIGCTRENGSDLFQRTIVRLSSDGTSTTRQEMVTRAQQLQEQQARAARVSPSGVLNQAITSDSGCAGSDIWLFDQDRMSGHEICFYGYGNAYLYNYGRFCYFGVCSSWDHAVRSYWAGSEDGFFETASDLAGGSNTVESFSAWAEVFTAGAAAQNSGYLILTD
jgi:hypothetical protein